MHCFRPSMMVLTRSRARDSHLDWKPKEADDGRRRSRPRPDPGGETIEEGEAAIRSHKVQKKIDADLTQRTIGSFLEHCRSVDEFQELEKIGEGTYGVVSRAIDRKSGEVVALKRIKKEENPDWREEIECLLRCRHPNVVELKEAAVGGGGETVFLVMEFLKHDLRSVVEAMNRPFSEREVKILISQIVHAVKHIHDHRMIHRDLKPANILVDANVRKLKICDFGLCRELGTPPYTHPVVTLWYRSPELLLGSTDYSAAIDMWSVGCIMAELLLKAPLFKGASEIDQLKKVFNILGTPDEKAWPGFAKLPGAKFKFQKQPDCKLREKFPLLAFTSRPGLSPAGFDLMRRLLAYDPEKRVTAEDALKHPWFRDMPKASLSSKHAVH